MDGEKITQLGEYKPIGLLKDKTIHDYRTNCVPIHRGSIPQLNSLSIAFQSILL